MIGIKVMLGNSGVSTPQFFIGVVENNVDKTMEGRVQVRAFGLHGTHEDIETQDLPWAICAAGNYDPNNPPPPLNSFVYGLFIDGRLAQHPMVLGLIPGTYNKEADPAVDGFGVIAEKDGDLLGRGYGPRDFNSGGGPDKLARGENLLETYLLSMAANRVHDQKIAESDETWAEPPPAYAAKYPYNKVLKTANHSIELDDSPGAERIMIHHRAGSYIQIDSMGTVSERAQGDRYEINIGTKHESSGHSAITINGNAHVYVKGNKTEEIEGDYKMLVHGNAEFGVGGQLNLNGGTQTQIRGGDVKIEANVGIMTLMGKKEIQFEATNQLNFVSQNIKNTALLSYDVYSNKSIKFTSVMDIHNVASNIVNRASGLLPPTPLSGSAGIPASAGWSLTTPAVHIAAATGSFSGLWNAGVINGGVGTFTALNAGATSVTALSAVSVSATTVSTTILAAPLPSGSVSFNSPGRITALTNFTNPVVPTLPAITIPATSIPLALPVPGASSGVAYPTGNSPVFFAKVLTSPFSLITNLPPLGRGAWGMTEVKMPEPPSYSMSCLAPGYFSQGWAGGYLSPTDDSAKGEIF
jgi:hypothetical protein